jgi:hypothetical protein
MGSRIASKQTNGCLGRPRRPHGGDEVYSQRPRRNLTARNRRAAVTTTCLEALETRQLMAYSPIGSLPDLTVTGQAGAIAAYGQPISVILNVHNLGASSTIEPLNLEPNATSSADAGPSHVGVYLLRNSRVKAGGAGSILIGEVPIGSIAQNSLAVVSATLDMPSKPARFPGSGGTVFIGFRADDLREVQDIDRTNNTAKSVPVQIFAPLPDLAAIAIDVPPVLQPGDTIAPTIKIANYGTANTALQGPVTVLLVASTDLNFGPTDVIIGKYEIADLPGLNQAPQTRTVLGDVTLDTPPNVVNLSTTTSETQNVTLPTGRGSYFIGVIVDPLNQIRELHEIGRGPSSALQLVERVNDVPGLASAGVLSDPSSVSNTFPIPAFAPLVPLSDFLTTPILAAQTATSSGIPSFSHKVTNAAKKK